MWLSFLNLLFLKIFQFMWLSLKTSKKSKIPFCGTFWIAYTMNEKGVMAI